MVLLSFFLFSFSFYYRGYVLNYVIKKKKKKKRSTERIIAWLSFKRGVSTVSMGGWWRLFQENRPTRSNHMLVTRLTWEAMVDSPFVYLFVWVTDNAHHLRGHRLRLCTRLVWSRWRLSESLVPRARSLSPRRLCTCLVTRKITRE